MRGKLGSLVIGAAAMGLVACSSGESAAKMPEPCAVLTLDKAKQLIGNETVLESQSSQTCHYKMPKNVAWLNVDHETDSDGAGFENSRQDGSTKVTGLGDDAFWTAYNHTLSVRAKGSLLEVAIRTDEADAAMLDKAKQVAADMLVK